MVNAGETVEIRDSQSGEDLTRSVLTQIIMERQPEKMSLFPTDMLHFILRSNDAMSGFLRDYFRHSLTYLAYLQRHNPAAGALNQPMHWMKMWLDGRAPDSSKSGSDAPDESAGEPPDEDLESRIQELEQRLRDLESKSD